jgi:hypothetical protein
VETRVELDVIGAVEGSDKSSTVQTGWDYLRHYQAAFEEYRDQPITLIEVGIGRGPSLRAWTWYFSEAQIIGIDTNPECEQYAGDRIKVEIGNQTDGDFIDRICTEFPPTIVIDDGSNQAGDIIATFERAFPHLLPGGLYVVEDLAMQFGDKAASHGVAKHVDASRYFLKMARDCMSLFGRSGNFLNETPGQFAPLVDSVTFIAGGAIIRRRREGRDVERAVEIAEAYLETRKEDVAAHIRLAEYILINNGPAERALAIVEAATSVEGPSARLLILRARVLLALRKPAQAKKFMADALNAPGLNGEARQRLAKLHQQTGDLPMALKLAETAAREEPNNKGYRHFADKLKLRVADAK